MCCNYLSNLVQINSEMSEVNASTVNYFPQPHTGPVLVPTKFKGKHAFSSDRSRNLLLTGRDGWLQSFEAGTKHTWLSHTSNCLGTTNTYISACYTLFILCVTVE